MFKRKSIIIFLLILVAAGFWAASALRRVYVLPIVMYHMVYPEAEPEYRPAVTVKAFERQMWFFKHFGYNVLSLENAVRLIRENKPLPPRAVVITFDDGYVDNYVYVFPILKKYNFPATFFLIVDDIGWHQQKMTWEMIKEMQGSGIVSFGSHTLGPEPLINIRSEKEIQRQIFDSKLKLEKKLGCEVAAFSYPEGRFNDKIRQWVIDAGYKFAVATNPGKLSPSNDVFALKRLRISANCDNPLVFWFETTGYYNFVRESKRKHR